MAEQPIQSDEIIDPKVFLTAIKNAQAFVVEFDKIIANSEKLITLNSKGLAGIKLLDSASIKEQNRLLDESSKLILQNEAAKRAKANTEKAVDNALKARLSLEKQFNKNVEDEANALKKNRVEVDLTSKAYSDLTKKYSELQKAQKNLDAAGRSNGVVFKGVKEQATQLRAELDRIEQGAGQFQRNVGNYKSSFDGLGNSVNQLTREFPAFAVSMQTGLLAISNNLPIFFDQLKKINEENKQLISQGKPTESALKQLGGALLSIGSLLSVGVTLLTVYGATFIKFAVDAVRGLMDVQRETITLNNYLRESKERIEGYLETQFELFLRLKVAMGTISEAQQKAALIDVKYAKLRLESAKAFGTKVVELAKETGVNLDKAENGYFRERARKGEYFDAFEIQRRKRYNADRKKLEEQYLKEINEIIVNERLESDVTKKEGEGSKIRERYTQEELIKKRSALDEIRQLEIDNLSDQQEREKQQIAFNSDKLIREIDDANKLEADLKKIALRNYKNEQNLINANVKDNKQKYIDLKKLKDDYEKEIKKIEADNISPEEQAQLRTQIEVKTNEAILEVDKKFAEEQNEANKKAVTKTFESRKKIETDNANFEISLLEKTYGEKLKTLSGFNLKEINDTEKQIAAKKIAQIKASADEKASLTTNAAEKEAIYNEANIAIQKADTDSNDKITANRQKAFAQAMQFEQQLLDSIAKAEAEKSKLRQDSFDKQISDQQKNIDTQRRLAENGKDNTLADEEARKIQLDRQKEDEKKKEIKRQKAIAFFKAFSGYLEKGDEAIVALGKAGAATYAADAIVGAFNKGTEKVEDDLKGNKIHNGTDGYHIAVDGKERIMTGDQNKMVGNLSNEDLAKLAYDYNNGLLDTVKYTAIPSTDFAKNVYESAQLHEIIALRKEIQGVKQAIENKPVSSWDMMANGDYIEKRIEQGIQKRITHKVGKRI